MFFLSVIWLSGLCMAVDATVLEENILGANELDVAWALGWMRMGSFTMNCLMFSVVISWGCP